MTILIQILGPLLILSGLACATVRHAVAIYARRPDPQARDILVALSAGGGLLASVLFWGCW